MDLRPYQVETLAALRAHFAAGNRAGLVEWPTGTGKTILAAEICRCANRQRDTEDLGTEFARPIGEAVDAAMADLLGARQ